MEKETNNSKYNNTRLSWSNWYKVISIQYIAVFVFLIISFICLIVMIFISNYTNTGLNQSEENLQFAQQSKTNINKITNGVVPALIYLERISVLTREYLNEVNVISIDPDYTSVNIKNIVSKINEEVHNIQNNKYINFPKEHIDDLNETVLVIQDLTIEVVETKSSYDLQQVLLDSEDVNAELFEKTEKLRLLLLINANSTSLNSNKDAKNSINNAANLKVVLTRIDSISQWMLTILLISILMMGVFLYRLAFTRLSIMEDYAEKVSLGKFDATIDYYSNDYIGNTGHAITEMGMLLSNLLTEAKGKADIAFQAQKHAENLSWLNDSLRILSEINREEIEINDLGEKTLKFIASVVELKCASLFVVGDNESLNELARYDDKDKTNIDDNRVDGEEDIYTLIYSSEMIGVLKITTFNAKTTLQKQFFKQACSQIAMYLHSAEKASIESSLVIEREKTKALKLLSDKMEIAKSAAEDADFAKSSFLANMSHEIRTPLTAIIGFSEILLEPNISKNNRVDSIHKVIRASKHLLHLINDILDISKIEANQLSVEHVPIDFLDLLSNVEDIVLQQALDKNLYFSIDYEDPIPLLFKSDPLRLKQVLINLCTNAIKFTKEGGVNLKVSFEDENDMLVFDLYDTGIGMTATKQSSLFTAFYQGDVNTTREYGGTGLGLYLSKQLVELLGGSIHATSTHGVGSHFKVKIHITIFDQINNTIDDADITEQNILVNNTDEPLHGKKVLLAEDSLDNQDLFSLFLERLGVTLTIVENGQLAVDKALNEQFDLILMDMQMPVMDGIQATSELRKKGYLGSIVALSANAMKKDVDNFFAAGCNDYLTKPISSTDLTVAVRKYIK